MSMSLNLDFIPQLKQARAELEDAKVSIKSGVRQSVDVAMDSNSPKLKKSADSMDVSSSALLSTIDETIESFSKLIKYYEGAIAAL